MRKVQNSFDLGNRHCLNENMRHEVPKIERVITILGESTLSNDRKEEGRGVSHLRDLIIRVSLEAHWKTNVIYKKCLKVDKIYNKSV